VSRPTTPGDDHPTANDLTTVGAGRVEEQSAWPMCCVAVKVLETKTRGRDECERLKGLLKRALGGLWHERGAGRGRTFRPAGAA